jgi:hypothetical protein
LSTVDEQESDSMRTNSFRRACVMAGVAFATLALGASAAFATFTGTAGTSVSRVSTLTQSDAATYTNTWFTSFGLLNIYARDGQMIDVTFTAESACAGSVGGWCSVRVLVDGDEASPVVGTDFAFDNAEGPYTWESHSVERVAVADYTGNHRVTVQTAQVGGASERLDDWTLRAIVVAR